MRAEFNRLEAMSVDPPPKQKHWRDNLTGVNGNDPMSPYVLPESTLVYNNITDVMNKKGFLAYYPQSYTPISNYFRDSNITPYFNPTDAEDWSKGRLTVAGMIELLSMGQTFEICRDQDFDEIIAIAENYLTHAQRMNTPAIVAYTKQVHYFLEHAKLARRKIYQRRGKETDIPTDFVGILKRIFGGMVP